MSFYGRILFLVVSLLVGLGIVMTYSASGIFAEQFYGESHYFLVRHLAYVGVGMLVLFLTAAVPVRFWKTHARALILLALAFLIAVFLPGVGRSAGGAKRWIYLGIINFQPVEFAKIALCVYLSDYLTRKMRFVKKGGLLIFVPPLILLGGLCVLLLLQPDLGSCFIVLLMTAILFFLAGIHLRYILAVSLMLPVIFYVLVARVPYRMSRVMAYLNPWADPEGSGFQLIQSMLSFGLGGMRGVGLGEGAQKLFYLPSGYNDFIFSVMAEELGLAGLACVILLYVLFFVCGIQMYLRARHEDEKLLVFSLVIMIVLQALLNMLVSTGLVPTKGLPLPFISYGGSSLVFNLMAVGLLLGLDRQTRRNR